MFGASFTLVGQDAILCSPVQADYGDIRQGLETAFAFFDMIISKSCESIIVICH